MAKAAATSKYDSSHRISAHQQQRRRSAARRSSMVASAAWRRIENEMKKYQ